MNPATLTHQQRVEKALLDLESELPNDEIFQCCPNDDEDALMVELGFPSEREAKNIDEVMSWIRSIPGVMASRSLEELAEVCAQLGDFRDDHLYALLKFLKLYGIPGSKQEFESGLRIEGRQSILVSGSARVKGGLSIGLSGKLLVLGDLHIQGALLAPEFNSRIAVVGDIFLECGMSRGEIILTGNLNIGDLLYFFAGERSARGAEINGNAFLSANRDDCFLAYDLKDFLEFKSQGEDFREAILKVLDARVFRQDALDDQYILEAMRSGRSLRAAQG